MSWDLSTLISLILILPRPVYRISLSSPASVRAIDPVCHRTFFFPVRVTSFPSCRFRNAIRHKYSIKMPKQHIILLIIECIARWWKFEIAMINAFWDMDLQSWENLITRKFDFWQSKLGQILTYGQNELPIVSICWSESYPPFFFLQKVYEAQFRKATGRLNPFHWRRW